ncbi:MAG: hypothetical protein ACLQKA_16535 [Bryobacteraceae bacterium]
MAIFRGQFAAFPRAVREYKIQELPFFRCGLTLEQGVRIVRQFQELDAFLDIAVVGRLVRPQVANDGRLRRTHLRGLGVEEVVGNPAVQLVLVHAVNAVLEAAVLTLKLGDGIIVELAFVPVTFA